MLGITAIVIFLYDVMKGSDLQSGRERKGWTQKQAGQRLGVSQRVADTKSGRGKSGRFRYIYLYLAHPERIHLIFLFAKNEQSNLSPAQSEALGKIIGSIKREA